jgi:hypothetical protein
MKRSFRMRQENETGEFCFIVGTLRRHTRTNVYFLFGTKNWPLQLLTIVATYRRICTISLINAIQSIYLFFFVK